jgi:hypothetical protein
MSAATLVPVVSAIVCLAIGLPLALLKKAPRHLLVPALIPLALVPAVLVSAAVATAVRTTFAASAAAGTGIMGDLLVAVARASFFGRLCTLALLALAALPAVRGLRRPVEGVSPRGLAAVLVLAPALAVGMAVLLGTSETRLTRIMTLALLPAEQSTPATEQELKRLVTGSISGEPVGVSQVSDVLTRQILLLTFAAPLLALAFVGLTGIAAAAGWRPQHPGSPHAAALGLLLTIAIVAAWTVGAYRGIGSAEAWARALSASGSAGAAAGPKKRPPAGALSEADRSDPELRARCEAGEARACSAVGGLMEDRERLALYERVCAKNGGEVCADLASLHLNGIGTAADPARAKALYERACRTGDASACGLFEHLSKSRAH